MYKVIVYAKYHRHYYQYDDEAKIWRLVYCHLTGSMDRCSSTHLWLPRGTKTDYTVSRLPNYAAESVDAQSLLDYEQSRRLED